MESNEIFTATNSSNDDNFHEFDESNDDQACTSSEAMDFKEANDNEKKEEFILKSTLCTLGDSVHLLKNAVRLPCKRYACGSCLWMSNPRNKSFNCVYCKKKHHLSVKYKNDRSKCLLEKRLVKHAKPIKEFFNRVLKNSVEEISSRLINYKDILNAKENYFIEELAIRIESVNVQLDICKEELLNDFDSKTENIEKEINELHKEEESKFERVKQIIDQDIELINNQSDSLTYLHKIESQLNVLDELDKKIENIYNQTEFNMSSKQPDSETIIGNFRIGSLNFPLKFKNIKRMNKIEFNMHEKARKGNSVAIDAELNIIILSTKTMTLTKCTSDASTVLYCVNLESLLINFNESKNVTKPTEQEKNSKSNDDDDDDDDVKVIEKNQKESLNDTSDDDGDDDNDDDDDDYENENNCKNNVYKHLRFTDFCVDENLNVYVICTYSYGVKILFLDKDFKCLTVFSLYPGNNRLRYMMRYCNTDSMPKITCYKNSNNEVLLYVCYRDEIDVYDVNTKKFIGILPFTFDRLINRLNLVRIRKEFIYLMGRNSKIIRYSGDLNKISYHHPTSSSAALANAYKTNSELFKTKLFDSLQYNCNSIQTFYGDDMGNLIFIGKSIDDSEIYLYSIHHSGSLLYKTKLFYKYVYDIAIDNMSFRDYRLICAVKNLSKNAQELMWIYEFENCDTDSYVS